MSKDPDLNDPQQGGTLPDELHPFHHGVDSTVLSESPLARQSEAKTMPAVVDRIGRYRVLERLGQGGVGEVYAAVSEEDGTLCAVKRLRPGLQNQAQARIRLKREAVIAAELSHPNIAQVLRASDEDGVFCIASEFVPGVDLDAVMRALSSEGRAMSAKTAAAIVLSLLDALGYAHEVEGPNGPLNLVHRDLSAGNVMLTFDGNVKVIDFGVAHADIDNFKTGPNVLVGTLRCLAPEQARGEPADKRSDLYAAGVLLYELLAGQPLLKKEHPLIEALLEIADRQPPTVSDQNGTTPAEMDAILRSALANQPSDRYEDARAFATDLSRVVGGPASATILKDILSYFFPDIRRRWSRLEARVVRVIDEVGFEPATRVSGPDWNAVSRVAEIDPSLMSDPLYFPTTSSDAILPVDIPTMPEEDPHPSQQPTNDFLEPPDTNPASDWMDPTDLLPVIQDDVVPEKRVPTVVPVETTPIPHLDPISLDKDESLSQGVIPPPVRRLASLGDSGAVNSDAMPVPLPEPARQNLPPFLLGDPPSPQPPLPTPEVSRPPKTPLPPRVSSSRSSEAATPTMPSRPRLPVVKPSRSRSPAPAPSSRSSFLAGLVMGLLVATVGFGVLWVMLRS